MKKAGLCFIVLLVFIAALVLCVNMFSSADAISDTSNLDMATTLLRGGKNAISWNGANISVRRDTMSLDCSTGDQAATFPIPSYDGSQMLRFNFTIDDISGGSFDIWVHESPGITDSAYHVVLSDITHPGTYQALIDPAYLTVYKQMQNANYISIVGHHAIASISGIEVYQCAAEDAGLSRYFQDSLIMLQKQKTSSTTDTEDYLVAPNGDRYIYQINNNGQLQAVSVIPDKSLFIGNSLLVGFGFGMAASSAENDYYYLVNQAITQINPNYTPAKMPGFLWEGCTTLDEQTAWLENELLPNLSPDLDLIVVQLGDNVNTEATIAVFAEGSKNLLQFIRTHCPNARVVWVGAWYQNEQKRSQMITSCTETGCAFIDIWDLSKSENANSIGNTWTDTDGNTHTITDAGIASHPGDAGFKAIANRILFNLGISYAKEYYPVN